MQTHFYWLEPVSRLRCLETRTRKALRTLSLRPFGIGWSWWRSQGIRNWNVYGPQKGENINWLNLSNFVDNTAANENIWLLMLRSKLALSSGWTVQSRKGGKDLSHMEYIKPTCVSIKEINTSAKMSNGKAMDAIFLTSKLFKWTRSNSQISWTFLIKAMWIR